MKNSKVVGVLAIGVLALAAAASRAQYSGGPNPSSSDTPSTTSPSDQPSAAPGSQDLGTKGNTTPTSGSSSMDRSNVSGMSDRELAGKVRRAIYDDKSLSSSAHDVKVSADKGRVVLKG